MTNLVIVGAALIPASVPPCAREIDERAVVTALVADAFPNYSICGLPFYPSGETLGWQMLAHRTKEELAAAGIILLLNYTVQSIDPAAYTILATPRIDRHTPWPMIAC